MQPSAADTMMSVRARSLSTSAELETRITRRKHVRQFSGPIDADLAATAPFSKLSLSPIEDENAPTQQTHGPSRPSQPFPLPFPFPTPTTTITENMGTHMDTIMTVTASYEHPTPTDISTVHWTESSIATVAETDDDTTQFSAPSDALLDAHTDKGSPSDSPGRSHLTVSSPSALSSRGDTSPGEMSPKAFSPLPPSSMPSSPATSLGRSSPCKLPASPQRTSQSSPVMNSPCFMSVDGSRVSSPDNSSESTTISPVKPSYRRLVASSPPPSSILGKRTGSEDESTLEPMGGSSPAKRIRTNDMRSSSPPAATTRRQTAISQQRSRKKLITPFRSPAMVRTSTPVLANQKNAGPSKPSPPLHRVAEPAPPNASKTMTKLALSSRAAAQFKSPMAVRSSGGARSVVLPTVAIQTLERKVTALKRALKIKRDGDEEKLASLATKWREAGREAAYELWDIVRELVPSAAEAAAPANDSWRSGWGWDGKDEPETENVVDDAMNVEEGEKPEETLGVMLRKLGIDPETFGWNDALESFVD